MWWWLLPVLVVVVAVVGVAAATWDVATEEWVPDAGDPYEQAREIDLGTVGDDVADGAVGGGSDGAAADVD